MDLVIKTFGDFVTNEWYFAFPLFLMLLVATVLLIWRLMLNMHVRTNLNEFLPAFQLRWEREGVEGAKRFCKAQPGVIPSKLFVAGLDTYQAGAAAMRRSMASVIELEILPDLNFLLAPILAIAKIATMVGLLGTVISMIGTFSAIAQASNAAGVTSSAGRIGLALFATAFGLLTAIPLVFAHVLVKDWIARFELKMKSAAQKLIVIVTNTKPGTAPPEAAPVKEARPVEAGRRPAAAERGRRE
jgi:biopolymer transport protein ExbB